MLAFLYLGRITGSWALGRDLYLVLLAGSLLSPALWVSRRSWTERGPTSVLIIGLATAPFLVVLDRGNSTGLVVAPLLGAAIAYVNERYGRMFVFIVICSLLKPQMILLALLFFVYRKYSYFVITVATSVVLTFVGFLFFPGSPSENSVNWIHALSRYREYQPLADSYPYNLGFGRSIVTMFDFLRLDRYTDPNGRTELASWLHRYSSLFGFLLVAITTLTMFLRSRGSNRYYPLLAVCVVIAIAPETSYGYYIALMLVPAAFILHDPRDRSPTERDDFPLVGIARRRHA